MFENVYFRSVSLYECEKENEKVNTNRRPNAEDRGIAGWLRPINTVVAGERGRRPRREWQPEGAGVSHIIEYKITGRIHSTLSPRCALSWEHSQRKTASLQYFFFVKD